MVRPCEGGTREWQGFGSLWLRLPTASRDQRSQPQAAVAEHEAGVEEERPPGGVGDGEPVDAGDHQLAEAAAGDENA